MIMKRRRQKARVLAIITIFLLTTSLFCVFAKEADENGDGKQPAKSDSKELQINGVDDLDGKVIGVQLGTTGATYASDYEGDEAGTKVEQFNKGADAIQALKQGKIDCVIIDEEPAKAFVDKNSDLTILSEMFVLEDYAICVAKGNNTLRKAIDSALEQMKQDGTLASIIDNYIGDNTGKTPYTSPEHVENGNGTLVMATNVAFPPYEFYQDGTAVGIDVDLAKAIADRLGMKLTIQDVEFDSIITAVQSGKADIGIAGMTVTEDRLKNIDFTQSYTTSKQVIIVRNDTTKEADASAVSKKLTFGEKLHQNFVEDARWKYLAKGFGNTLIITFFAALIGILLGFLVGVIRVTHDKNGTLTIINWICKLYLTVVRGTPMMVQLLIIYYVIFASMNMNKVVVAIIAFGINSGAYVAEVVRSGIMSIDNGQIEAGQSLGLSFSQTMTLIVLPQGFKNVLPALGNEFISLLKETSISGYIGLMDLTRGGDIIRSATWEAFIPLVAVALIYLVLVMLLSAGVNHLERRLKRDER